MSLFRKQNLFKLEKNRLKRYMADVHDKITRSYNMSKIKGNLVVEVEGALKSKLNSKENIQLNMYF